MLRDSYVRCLVLACKRGQQAHGKPRALTAVTLLGGHLYLCAGQRWRESLPCSS